MDIISVIVKFLSPCLPFLLTMGTKTAEGASQKVGEDVWNKAKVIWGKLQPKVEAKEEAKKAAAEAAKNLEDQDFQGAFRKELKQILTAEPELVKEIAQILPEILGTQKSDSGAAVHNPQAFDESTQLNANIINQPNLSKTYNNSPK